jgi:hypothetical protein
METLERWLSAAANPTRPLAACSVAAGGGMAISTRLAPPGPGAREPGRAGMRQEARAPSGHVRQVLGAKPYFGGSNGPSTTASLPLRVWRQPHAKAGAGAAGRHTGAVSSASFCGCSARAD